MFNKWWTAKNGSNRISNDEDREIRFVQMNTMNQHNLTEDLKQVYYK